MRFFIEDGVKKKYRFRGSKALIPLDNGILVVESCDDIVIGFNGDSYMGMLRSVPRRGRVNGRVGWVHGWMAGWKVGWACR